MKTQNGQTVNTITDKVAKVTDPGSDLRVSLELVFQQALNGLSFGALLFILASGLSLVFGMMDVVNLAHGAFYMLGAYVALSVVQLTGSFWIAMVAAPLVLALLGLVIEPLLLRRLRGRHLDQVLLTIGVSS